MTVSCGEAPVDLMPRPAVGGGPLNVAVAAARLGCPSAFVGCVSTDDYGELIREHLTGNGVGPPLAPAEEVTAWVAAGLDLLGLEF